MNDNGLTTKMGALDMQVCVPSNWTDAQIRQFAETDNPCGTKNGWKIRRQGDLALGGANERTQCADCTARVHIMLDA